jgi:hypothetical protein
MNASEFYVSCRNGDITKVKQLLSHLTIEEIDRIESNGSTALHAASYFGHAEIVHLLLEKGASRRQKNKYDATPADEAKTLEITHLFNRDALSSNSRFVANSASREWSIKSEFAAASHHRRFYAFTERPPISALIHQVLDAKELQDAAGIDRIAQWMNEATNKDDTTLLVRSYTAETDFYKRLNVDLADLKDLTNEDARNPGWSCAFARYIASDPALRKHRWMGTTYRGMQMTDTDISMYAVGQMLMNRAFLSTSRLREVAEGFAKRDLPADKKAAICTYVIKDNHTALDIKEYSEYPQEEEVLILPCLDFEVTKLDSNSEFVEIEVLLR